MEECFFTKSLQFYWNYYSSMGVCHVFQIVQVVPNRGKHPKWSLHWTQSAKIILLIFTMAISKLINACTQIDSEMENFFWIWQM